MTATETAPVQPGLEPQEVSDRRFPTERKGYRRSEVREFLESVAEALARRDERILELERLAARSATEGGEAGSEDAGSVLDAVAAEAWRDEVLADLDSRRRELNSEVVRLRAGRDRLRDDLSAVLDELAGQLRKLDGILQAARSAGDAAEQQARADEPRSVAEQQAELDAARLAGFATVPAADLPAVDPPAVDPPHADPPAADPPAEPATHSASEGPSGGAATQPVPGSGSVPPGESAPDPPEVRELFARLRAGRTDDPAGKSRLPQ